MNDFSLGRTDSVAVVSQATWLPDHFPRLVETVDAGPDTGKCPIADSSSKATGGN